MNVFLLNRIEFKETILFYAAVCATKIASYAILFYLLFAELSAECTTVRAVCLDLLLKDKQVKTTYKAKVLVT